MWENPGFCHPGWPQIDTIWQYLSKFKIYISPLPPNLLLGIFPIDTLIHVQREECARIFITVLNHYCKRYKNFHVHQCKNESTAVLSGKWLLMRMRQPDVYDAYDMEVLQDLQDLQQCVWSQFIYIYRRAFVRRWRGVSKYPPDWEVTLKNQRNKASLFIPLTQYFIQVLHWQGQ